MDIFGMKVIGHPIVPEGEIWMSWKSDEEIRAGLDGIDRVLNAIGIDRLRTNFL